MHAVLRIGLSCMPWMQLAEPDPRVTRLVSDLGEGRPLGSARGWTAPPAVLVLNKV